MSVKSVIIGERAFVKPEIDRGSSLFSLLFENIQFNNTAHIEIDDQANYIPVG